MKLILFFLQIAIAVFSVLFFTHNASAETGTCLSFTSYTVALECEQNPTHAYQNNGSLTLTFIITGNQKFSDQKYKIARWHSNESYSYSKIGSTYSITLESDIKLSAKINFDTIQMPELGIYNKYDTIGIWNYKIFTGKTDTKPNDDNTIAEGTYNILPPGAAENEETNSEVGFPILTVLNARNGAFGKNEEANLLIENVDISENYTIWFSDKDRAIFSEKFNNSNTTSIDIDDDVKGTKKIQLSVSTEDTLGKRTLCVGIGKAASLNKSLLIPNPPICTSYVDFNVQAIAPDTSIVPTEIKSNNPTIPSGNFVNIVPDTDYQVPPPPCATLTPDGKCISVHTAIGRISTEPQGFVRSIFSVVLGLAGGIALILIMVSGYKFMASSGNPEGTKAATEQLTSAVIGLLFIIFSFVILEIIGVDILKIPGFQ